VYGVLLRGSQKSKVLLIQENKLRPMLLSQHHPQAWSVTWLEAIRLHNLLGLSHVMKIIILKPWPRQDYDGRESPDPRPPPPKNSEQPSLPKARQGILYAGTPGVDTH